MTYDATTALQKGMRELEKQAPLTFRQKQARDEAFLLQVTMAAMKQVFEKSTGWELTEEFVRENINSSGTTVIIEQAGQPIGYYCYSIYAPGRMYWGSLILSPEARGRGIGQQINRRVEAEARAHGVRVIDGHVQVENKRAVDFWLKSGWKIIREEGQGNLAIQKVI